MIIVGAGMAGCLAGVLCAPARIHEANDSLPDYHKAVLRFRSNKIAMSTGIDFREVTVQKAIWSEGKEAQLSPRLINLYSSKVADKFMSRSITSLESVQRYIAPSDFHQILADMCGDRIEYNSGGFLVDQLKHGAADEPIISTIPMPALAKITGAEDLLKTESFARKSIGVARYQIPNCDVFQTIYFPDKHTSVYRASITSDMLMIEYINDGVMYIEDDGSISTNKLIDVCAAFGINKFDLEFIDNSVQSLGKIAPIDDGIRKNFMFRMTHDHSIYSLGRFATWKNILLDDVYEDIYAIRKMIKGGLYVTHKEMSCGS